MDIWVVFVHHIVLGVYSTYERAATAAELETRNGHPTEIWHSKVNKTNAVRLGENNGT